MNDRNKPLARPQPTPLVPQTAREWIASLGRVARAALALFGCSLVYLASREGLSDTASH